jgi:hypothetical protein
MCIPCLILVFVLFLSLPLAPLSKEHALGNNKNLRIFRGLQSYNVITFHQNPSAVDLKICGETDEQTCVTSPICCCSAPTPIATPVEISTGFLKCYTVLAFVL